MNTNRFYVWRVSWEEASHQSRIYFSASLWNRLCTHEYCLGLTSWMLFVLNVSQIELALRDWGSITWTMEYKCVLPINVDRNSLVGIAIRYRLEGPGIKSLWRRDFSHLSRPSLGPIQRLVIPEGKTVEAWCWSSSLYSTKVKERVYLYLSTLSGPSWYIIGLIY